MPAPETTRIVAIQLVMVFVAGGVGACLRVASSTWVDARVGDRLPFAGTLAVNLVGCLSIGVITGLMPAGPWRTAVVGGLLGGFTTYSAFGLLGRELLAGARWGALAVQIGAHVVLGIAAVAIGLWIARALAGGS